jgi:tetratricopeptide (TPR) repeat protein
MSSPRHDLTFRARRLSRVIFTLAVMLGLAGLTGCESDSEHRSVTRLPEASEVASRGGAEPQISQQLMVSLAQAKNFHHRAKVYMSDGNLPMAIESVRSILSLRFPPGAAETEDVRADARALLAKLMIGQGNLGEAERIVDEGLATASRDSFFIANLYTVKGEVHEAQATAAAAQGEAGAASAASYRREAISAFSRSIEINSAIQKRLYEGAAP